MVGSGRGESVSPLPQGRRREVLQDITRRRPACPANTRKHVSARNPVKGVSTFPASSRRSFEKRSRNRPL
jgi:hypothetical protein